MDYKQKRSCFYIAVDCEGIACVVGTPGEGLGDNENYQFARRQATLEANAAAQALFEYGAQEVWIWDNHGTGVNLEYALLDKRCKIVLGSGHRERFPRIDERFGGVLFIGYHSRDNVREAVLCHTYSSHAYQSYQINGLEVGEMQIDAAFAGEKGVPVLFVSSDDKAVAQAKESFPWVGTVQTKESLSWNSVISLHPQTACDLIHEQVCKACERIEEMKPFTFAKPLHVEIRYRRLEDAQNAPLFDKDGKPYAFGDAFTRIGTVNAVYDLRL